MYSSKAFVQDYLLSQEGGQISQEAKMETEEMDIEEQVCKLHNTVDNFSGGKIANYIDEW